MCGASALSGENLSSFENPKQPTTSMFAAVVYDEFQAVQAIRDCCQPTREFTAVDNATRGVPVRNSRDGFRVVTRPRYTSLKFRASA